MRIHMISLYMQTHAHSKSTQTNRKTCRELLNNDILTPRPILGVDDDYDNTKLR